MNESNFICLYHKFKTITEIFEDKADKYPKKPAVYYFDTIITNEELRKYVNAFAYFLAEHGFKKGDRIAIYTQNIPQFIITVLAAWKIGAIPVPLNIMFKQKELIYHLNDSGAKALISLEREYQEYAREIIPNTNVEMIILTSGIDFINGYKPNLLKDERKTMPLGKENDFMHIIKKYENKKVDQTGVKPEDLAFIHYTAGTTGVPKGAMTTHYNVIFNANTYKEVCDLTENDVNVALAPLFHVTGTIANLSTAFYVGSPLLIFYRFEAGEALRLIEKWRGTFTVASITAFIALLNHPDISRRDISSFVKTWSGGAPIPPSIVERWMQVTGKYIYPVWGMTETTSPGTIVKINERAPIDDETKSLSVGKVVPGGQVKIVDPDEGTIELEPGQIGELIIKGPFIISGYWNKPEETAKAIKNGWMYTGDLAKMDNEGWVYYIDRKKDIINVSGYKVWPREVEDVIYEHPAVKEVAVVGTPDPYRGESPKGFIVLKEEYEGKVTEEEVINFVREKLATYKRPRKIEFVKELPKNPQGKILRRVLKEQELKKYKERTNL